MKYRRATMSIPDSTDSNALRNFADSVFNNPMYDYVITSMRTTPGFVKKSHSMVDEVSTSFLISEICFDSLETFDAYVSDPSVVSLWDYLIDLAKENGITVEIVDGTD